MFKKAKRLTSMLMAAVMMSMIIIGSTSVYVNAEMEDTEAPLIFGDTLSISTTTAGIGDTISIKVMVADKSGIGTVFVRYIMPQTGRSRNIYLYYNKATGYCEGDFKIGSNHEKGKWVVDLIYASDTCNNYGSLYSSEKHSSSNISLSAGNFEITSDIDDITGPEIDISSIYVNKKEAMYGDTVKVSMKVTDPSGVNSVSLRYVVKINGINTFMDIDASYNSLAELYEARIPITDKIKPGEWKLYYVYAEDIYNNKTKIFDSYLYPDTEYTADLSAGNYNVVIDSRYNGIKPLEGITVYTEQADINDVTIDGDVYIAPGVRVKLTNVTVTGYIYVLGGLELSNVKCDWLYGRYMTYDNIYSLKNGQVRMNKSSDFSGTMKYAPSYLPEVPVRIDEAVNSDGKLYMTGATANICDMYVCGKKINTGYEGKFIVENIDIGTSEYVTIQWRMYDGTVKEQKVQLRMDNVNIPDIQQYVYAHLNETVSDVSAGFSEYSVDIQITDSDGVIKQGTDRINTGYVLNYIRADKVLGTSTIVIKGDVDGNGSIDVLDMEVIQKSILGIGDKLAGAYKEAALITEGDAISVLDMEAIQKDILGIQKI